MKGEYTHTNNEDNMSISGGLLVFATLQAKPWIWHDVTLMVTFDLGKEGHPSEHPRPIDPSAHPTPKSALQPLFLFAALLSPILQIEKCVKITHNREKPRQAGQP